MTNEQPFIHRALHDRGIELHTLSLLNGHAGGVASLANIFTGAERQVDARSVVLVGHRAPEDGLYRDLAGRRDEFADVGIVSMHRIGDALAPGALVHAVYSGHLHARLLDEPGDPGYLRDIQIGIDQPGPAWTPL